MTSVTRTMPLIVPAGERLIPGKMYLRLFHGRDDPNQEMDDWGFDGPTFGPLVEYLQTYGSTFRAFGEQASAEIWFESHDGMIVYEGSYYGDMGVFIAKSEAKGQMS